MHTHASSSSQSPQSQAPFTVSPWATFRKSYSTKLHLLTNDSSSHLKKTTLQCFRICNCQSELLQNLGEPVVNHGFQSKETCELIVSLCVSTEALGNCENHSETSKKTKAWGLGTSGWEVPV